jgi:hypothetical protein
MFIDVRWRGGVCRDELPFLDTDIARGTVLLTLDSFVFFLEEFGLPSEEFPADTRYNDRLMRVCPWY